MSMFAKPPRSFWVISVLLFLWEAMGVGAYLNEVSVDVSTLGSDARALYDATPMWATAAFAIAVWGGALGAILMLFRRRQARLFFMLSLLAAIVQFAHWLGFSGVFTVLGPTSMIMPLLVIVIGTFAVYYSQLAATQGWIR